MNFLPAQKYLLSPSAVGHTEDLTTFQQENDPRSELEDFLITSQQGSFSECWLNLE